MLCEYDLRNRKKLGAVARKSTVLSLTYMPSNLPISLNVCGKKWGSFWIALVEWKNFEVRLICTNEVSLLHVQRENWIIFMVCVKHRQIHVLHSPRFWQYFFEEADIFRCSRRELYEYLKTRRKSLRIVFPKLYSINWHTCIYGAKWSIMCCRFPDGKSFFYYIWL